MSESQKPTKEEEPPQHQHPFFNLDDASSCALDLLLNQGESLPELPEDGLSQLVNSGFMTPSTAQAFFGQEGHSLPNIDASQQADDSREASLLRNLTQNLATKKQDLLSEYTSSTAQSQLQSEPVHSPAASFASASSSETRFFSASSTSKGLEFDPEDLMVEDLRQECRLRNLATSGSKNVLVKRLKEAIAARSELATHRLTEPVKKRKRTMNKREPQRSSFATEEDYISAWHKWRQSRDHNNESVKRSRENARAKKEEHEKICKERERENQELTTEVQKLRDQVVFLTKVLKHPETLSEQEKAQITALMKPLGRPDDN